VFDVSLCICPGDELGRIALRRRRTYTVAPVRVSGSTGEDLSGKHQPRTRRANAYPLPRPAADFLGLPVRLLPVPPVGEQWKGERKCKGFIHQ